MLNVSATLGEYVCVKPTQAGDTEMRSPPWNQTRVIRSKDFTLWASIVESQLITIAQLISLSLFSVVVFLSCGCMWNSWGGGENKD